MSLVGQEVVSRLHQWNFATKPLQVPRQCSKYPAIIAQQDSNGIAKFELRVQG